MGDYIIQKKKRRRVYVILRRSLMPIDDLFRRVVAEVVSSLGYLMLT